MCHCQGHSSCCSSGGCGCQSKSSSSSKGCSCGCQPSQCCQKSCCGGSCGGDKSCSCECHYATKFLELADRAWMEVLKEKIKEHIQSNAKNMDELARLISEANHARWQKKMEDKECCGGYEEKLKEFFHQSCCTTHKQNNKPKT